jgi:hypothetical protein
VSPIRVLKAVGALFAGVALYLVRGMSIVGLGAHAVAIPMNDRNPDIGDPLPGPAELSHDERLWEEELAVDDAGAS